MSILAVDPKRVRILSDTAFADLMNRLIRAEGGRLGLRQDLIDTTLRTSVPDGGVDASVHPDRPLPDTKWLPDKASTWQYKSGACPSANNLSETEFKKPGVIAAISKGLPYVFVTGDDITGRKKNEIRSAIDNLYSQHALPSSGRVLTASEIAGWVDQFPAISVHIFQTPLVHWQVHEHWASGRDFQNEFVEDAQRAELITRIKSDIAAGQELIRVVGDAGVGKTRTVLEALRDPGLRERVLYLRDATLLSSEFFWSLSHQTPCPAGILVVDECDGAAWQQLVNLAGVLGTGFSVIGVGPSGPGVQRRVLELGRMDDEQLAELLESVAPGTSEPARRAIARRCGGSPKLVVLFGAQLAEAGAADSKWHAIEGSVDVVEYLNERVFPVVGSAVDVESQVMRGISLFVGLGWFDDLSGEGEMVLDFLGLSGPAGRDAAAALIERGVVSRRGRLLYPSPDVLANYLTRKTLKAYTPREVRGLYEALPGRAQQAFLERLRQLGEDVETQAVVKEVIGDAVFFLSLSDLESRDTARTLRALVPSFPELTLNHLADLIGEADREGLLNVREGRRDLVWALEELAWWPDYFPTAARALGRLAWAENETYANNATGTWADLFQIPLGGTATPFPDRVVVMREFLEHQDPSLRLIGLAGLKSALATQHVTRFGGPPTDTGRPPPPEWRPSYAQWRVLLQETLPLLEARLGDRDETVREEAIEVLAERTTDLISAGLAQEWAQMAGRMSGEPYGRRAALLRPLAIYLRHSESIKPEDRKRLEQVELDLQGQSYSDRLRRLVSPWDYVDAYRNRETYEAEMDVLAREGLASPDVVLSEYEWLTGGEANGAFRFGWFLGRGDEGGDLSDALLERYAEDLTDDRLLLGYVAGQEDVRGPEWLSALLDEWSGVANRSLLVANVVWRVQPTDEGGKRLADLIRAGRVPGAYLRNLVSGFWAQEVSPAVLQDLIEASGVDTTPVATSGRLWLLDQYLSERPEAAGALASLRRTLVEEGAGVRTNTMDPYHWKRLAEQEVILDPLGVAEIVVHVASQQDSGGSDDLRAVLDATVEQAGVEVFQSVLGPALIASPSLLWRLDSPIQGRSLLSLFDPATLVAWCEEEPEGRLPVIASAAPVGTPGASPLARALLVTFGRKRVGASLAATFGTGMWRGPESHYLQSQIDKLKEWEQDDNDEVRAWARELIGSYEAAKNRAATLEEEED